MKAKLVENMEFKRGLGTKGSLELGGFIPEEVFIEIQEIAHKKWMEFVNNLINKRIKFTGSESGRGNWAPREIKVKKVDARYFEAEFAVMDLDDVWYTVLSSEKIYIE